MVNTEFDLLILPFLIYNLRHFQGFYNVLSHCLMIEMLPSVFNMDCKWPKHAFCSDILCFILLRGYLNICGWETDEKLTRF